jgi:predicted SPOUT superfamily RNA methylase MTH1
VSLYLSKHRTLRHAPSSQTYKGYSTHTEQEASTVLSSGVQQLVVTSKPIDVLEEYIVSFRVEEHAMQETKMKQAESKAMTAPAKVYDFEITLFLTFHLSEKCHIVNSRQKKSLLRVYSRLEDKAILILFYLYFGAGAKN